MTTTVGSSEQLQPDEMHVVHARAAGLDVHKMQITASVRLCQPAGGVQCATHEFSALPAGLEALTQWLAEHRVTAAAMEGTGIFWKAPFEALEDAGIAPLLLHAQFVKQLKGRKSDVADSLWLARICTADSLLDGGGGDGVKPGVGTETRTNCRRESGFPVLGRPAAPSGERCQPQCGQGEGRTAKP